MSDYNLSIAYGFVGFDLDEDSKEELKLIHTYELEDIRNKMLYWANYIDTLIKSEDK